MKFQSQARINVCKTENSVMSNRYREHAKKKKSYRRILIEETEQNSNT